VHLDLRSKVKFQDKLTFMMNNQNTFLKHRSQTVIVIGVKELLENTLSIKKDGEEGTESIGMGELYQLIDNK
jgi:hypothetical protein